MKHYVTNRRIEIKKYLLEGFGNKCSVCGYNKCINALEFHHLDPDEKDFGIGLMTSKSLKSIVDEVRKCTVLCSNCHREFHAGLIKLENVTRLPDDFELLTISEKKTQRQICKCGGKKTATSNKCMSCWALFQRTTIWPTPDELKDLMENNTWVSLGKKYGVAANTVKNWAKKYNLI